MKYILSKNIETITDENSVTILNRKQNYTSTLRGCAKTLFEIIINKDDTNAVNYLIQNKGCTPLESQVTVNKLLYHLLNGRYIESVNNYEIAKEVIYPKFCILEITDTCNFRCEHCYVDKTGKNQLEIDDIKTFANELFNINCNRITLSGGEIFTHKNFLDIYTYLYDKGFIVSLNSNGSLLNDGILNALKVRPPFAIEISLYGNNSTNFDNFTKTKDYFEKTIKNIQTLKENNINIFVKNVLNNNNKQFFDDIKKLAKQLDIPFRSDYYVFPKTNCLGAKNKQLITPSEAITYLKQQKNATEFYLDKYSNQTNSDFVFNCKQNDDSIFVDSSLNISMCICMQHLSKPYEQGKLAQIILDLQKIKQLKYTHNAKCKDCNLKPLCRYCPAKFYQITFDYEKPDEWFCKLGNLIYDNFIKGYKFIHKKYLNEATQNALFEIIKGNMEKLNFTVTEKDAIIWKESINNNLKKDNYYLYVIYHNGIVVGFVAIEIIDNNPYLCELQFGEDFKHTKLILETIKFIFNNNNFKQYDCLLFGINKNNTASIKTFTHLGGEVTHETERAYRYKISREKVAKYLEKIK